MTEFVLTIAATTQASKYTIITVIYGELYNWLENSKEFLNRCLPTNKVTVLDKFFTKTGFKDFFVVSHSYKECKPCISYAILQEVTEDFDLYWKVLVYSCLLALAVSLGFLLLFPFLAGFLVWVILTGVTVACLALSVYLW